MRDNVEITNWHEDPERPGIMIPDDGPIILQLGDSFTISQTVIDDVPLPWAEGTVIRKEQRCC